MTGTESVRPPRRWPRNLAVALAVAGVAVAVWLGIRTYDRRVYGKQARDAWATYARCLVGDVPPGERVGERLRRIHLAVQWPAEGEVPASAWPRRCQPYAARLVDLAFRLDDARLRRIGTSAEENATRTLSWTPFKYGAIDTLWTDAVAAGLGGGTAAEVPPVPPPAALVTKSELAVVPGEVVGSAPAGEAGVHILFASVHVGAKTICTVRSGDDPARCVAVRSPLEGEDPAGRPYPVETDDGAAPLILRQWQYEGEPSVYDPTSGQVLLSEMAGDAYGWKDGALAALLLRPPRVHLVRRSPAGARVEQPLAVELNEALLAGDLLVTLERPKDKPARLLVTPLVPPPAPLGAPRLVAEIPAAPPAMLRRGKVSACRAGELIAVTYSLERTWNLVLLDASGPRPMAGGEGDMPSLTCDAEGVTALAVTYGLSYAEPRQVGVWRCRADACKAAVAEIALLGSKASSDLVPVGDAVLDVWVPRSGLLSLREAGGLRARLAPLAGLAQAPERVVMDDSLYGGPNIYGVQALPLGEGALIVLEVLGGNVFLRMTADGRFAPVPIERVP